MNILSKRLKVNTEVMMKSLVFPLLLIPFMAGAQKLRMATYQYADNNRIANITPLALHLENKLGVDIEVKSYPSVHLFIEGIMKDEVDIALINTLGFLLLKNSGQYPMKPIAALQVREGTSDNYKTAMVVPSSSAIMFLNDLPAHAGQMKLMLVNPGSTSGNLVPRLVLGKAGLTDPEQNFRQLQYAGTHRASMDSVIQRKADVAAVGSSEYFAFTSNTKNSELIRLIWLSPEIPLGPVLVRERLTMKLQKAILKELTLLDKANQKALQAVKDGWSEAREAERFTSVEANYYAPFEKQFGGEEQLREILSKIMN